jgi:uncharacterized protein YacL (UPF0231 family)
VSTRITVQRKLQALRNRRLSELGQETPLILPHVIKSELEKVAEETTAPELLRGKAYELLLTAQEMIVRENTVAIALRPDIGFWKYVTVDSSSMNIMGVETAAYLAFKEKLSGQRMFCIVLLGA